MKRRLLEKLIQWKTKPGRMPLIVNGARQVGKTYILKQFGKEYYQNCVYINLEINSSANSYFHNDLTPARIIQYLETVSGERILPGETLVILDEIQSSERALLALKAFSENAPQYHLAAAGSLLGVALNRGGFSYPVGKTDELTLYPLDFEEFLWALNKESLASQIQHHFDNDLEMPEALHNIAMEHYKQYLITGGMPAVVQEYVQSDSFLSVSDILGRILNDYIADMAKYANSATGIKIRACYNSIPAQLAKENTKFQYKIVQKGGTATIFGESIEWLNFANIVLKCQKTEHGFMPLGAYVSLPDFKLYMGDVGMLTMKSGIAHQTILSNRQEDNMFLGALSENFVAQAFAAKKYPLYYWKNENTAELDFVLQKDDKIIPVEVKKGMRTKSISLSIFREKYKNPYAIRISQKNFGFENNIKSVPFYAAFCI